MVKQMRFFTVDSICSFLEFPEGKIFQIIYNTLISEGKLIWNTKKVGFVKAVDIWKFRFLKICL